MSEKRYRIGRRSGLIVTAILLMLNAGASPAAQAKQTDVLAIEALMHCYAAGTDAIGDKNGNSKPTAAGLTIYQDCFTEDAEFNVWFPHQAFDSQTFPNSEISAPSPPSPVVGSENWAEFVNSVFRSKGYDLTQHAISNITVEVDGRRGKLTAYLIATHVISGKTPAEAAQCVEVANGSYSLATEKIHGQWRIARLDVTLISFSPVFSSGKGCKVET